MGSGAAAREGTEADRVRSPVRLALILLVMHCGVRLPFSTTPRTRRLVNVLSGGYFSAETLVTDTSSSHPAASDRSSEWSASIAAWHGAAARALGQFSGSGCAGTGPARHGHRFVPDRFVARAMAFVAAACARGRLVGICNPCARGDHSIPFPARARRRRCAAPARSRQRLDIGQRRRSPDDSPSRQRIPIRSRCGGRTWSAPLPRPAGLAGGNDDLHIVIRNAN